MTIETRSFIFQRVSDPTFYRFNFIEEKDGYSIWKREDIDLWCIFVDQTGWCVVDAENNQVSWPVQQSKSEKGFPPKGRWISKKKYKSYVYELRYIDEKTKPL